MRLRHVLYAAVLTAPIVLAGAAGAAADHNSAGFKACKDSLFSDHQCECVAAEFATKGKGINEKALVTIATDFTLAGYPQISMEDAKKDLQDLKIAISDAELKKIIDIALGAAHCTQ